MSDAKAMVLVTLSVDQDKEAEFNRFYHHRFLPAFLDAYPDIISIKRYEEHGISGTARWYNKQYLTIYELAQGAIANVDAMFGGPQVKDVVAEFQQWKASHLRNFSRMTFRPTWSHERQSADGPLSGRPFFMWSLEMKKELDAEFQEWYQNTYLPKQVADIPTWTDVNRYQSMDRDPLRHLTIFETANESTLARCIEDLRTPHRSQENSEWQQRVQAAVTWHDASSFRPIYRRPG